MDAAEDSKAALRNELGLDRNLVIQYLIWISKVIRGDLGRSVISQQPVLETILEKLPATAILAVAATTISFTIALFLGTVAGASRGSFKDMMVLIVALLWVSIPTFWLGIMLIIVFSIHIPVFPAFGYISPLQGLSGCLRHLILPAITLGAIMAGGIARLSRSEMIEELGKDYITTAWAKGLSRPMVIYKHALKNSMIPVVTFTGVQLGSLLGGAIVTEQVFAWPGVGRLAVQAIFARDYPVVQGIVLVVAIIFVLTNLLVDISYTFLNPRIRYGTKD
jgi:ABC-type dipeptide/oligopeptide/nickel transport system permease component